MNFTDPLENRSTVDRQPAPRPQNQLAPHLHETVATDVLLSDGRQPRTMADVTAAGPAPDVPVRRRLPLLHFNVRGKVVVERGRRAEEVTRMARVLQERWGEVVHADVRPDPINLDDGQVAPWGPALEARAERYIGAQNVHDIGRDAATRLSVRRLQQRGLMRNDIHSVLNDMRAYTGEHGGKHAQQALLALDGPVRLFPSLSADNLYALDSGNVQTAPLVAMFWHAACTYEPPGGDAETADRERAILRLGLVRALAACISDGDEMACAPGAVQHMCLVLQGFYPECTVESEIPRATVNQFVQTVAADWQRRSQRDGMPSRERRQLWLGEARGQAESVYGEGPQATQMIAQISENLQYILNSVWPLD